MAKNIEMQVKNESGYEAIYPVPAGHKNSHKTGGADAITPSDIGAVPTSRTVNGKALSANITLSASDVKAYTKSETDALLSTAGSKPKSVLVTLSASSWNSSTLTQTVTVTGVSATESAQLIQPIPTVASQTDYYEAGILCTAQGANSLTFTASTAPTNDLSVYIVIQEVNQVQ